MSARLAAPSAGAGGRGRAHGLPAEAGSTVASVAASNVLMATACHPLLDNCMLCRAPAAHTQSTLPQPSATIKPRHAAVTCNVSGAGFVSLYNLTGPSMSLTSGPGGQLNSTGSCRNRMDITDLGAWTQGVVVGG